MSTFLLSCLGIFVFLAIAVDAIKREDDDPSEFGTRKDPRIEAMDKRMRAYGARLKREGRSLLSGKAYIPTLTKAVPQPPPKADKVIPIRRKS